MIINISEAANLAFHALTYLVNNSVGSPIRTGEIAESFNVSEAHLSKVFQRLTKAGLVKSIRGPKGGFVLDWEPESITLLEIYEAIDGPVLSKSYCLLGEPVCNRVNCLLGNLVRDVHEQVTTYLAGTTLADLIEK